MGTNYYLHEQLCEHCGRFNQRHIGKSSGGWCFSLHVYPEEGINDLDDWKARFGEASIIKNEYGDTITPQFMLEVITERMETDGWDNPPFSYPSWDAFHAGNHSMRGPNNLLRHQLNEYCIKHGEGTWDCIVGDFS